ncbi:hypothetical protein CC1G_06635 [Coprinopsis cinerea okayama7|uniref:DUF6697 domain-containing protein n=1 Tax=Coprinopsis cinerea (strain Okayama-7 / 130 / ATCC MYA-4618 / FGSC 9003) TaxID=240176 RepID=A8P7T7_COPC7|nr:hypothetical protein CC1G_06635 [Coprinopsis cinerea okayama7\|eukprot:XP_001839422.2 hypothetical protein CC1G_06635 [Coprinopsis cinerea okayama7\
MGPRIKKEEESEANLAALKLEADRPENLGPPSHISKKSGRIVLDYVLLLTIKHIIKSRKGNNIQVKTESEGYPANPFPPYKNSRSTSPELLFNDDHEVKKEEDQEAKPKVESMQGLKSQEQAPSIEEEKPIVVKTERKLRIKKEETMTFSLDVMRSRFERKAISLGPYPIERNEVVNGGLITREFISKVYGGNMREAYPTMAPAKLAIHGFNHLFFLSDSFQPQAPKGPGEPGLFISVGTEDGIGDLGVRKVLVRVSRKTPAKWQYRGEYHIDQSKSLTADEWRAQTPALRNMWARELGLPSCGWGAQTRARIYIRKTYEREPLENEWKGIVAEGLDKTITPEEIALALTKGEETLTVFTMKCVGYDTRFQKHLIKEWERWTPPPKAPQQKKEGAGGGGGGGKKKSGKKAQQSERPPKRRKVSHSSESNSDDQSDVVNYRPRMEKQMKWESEDGSGEGKALVRLQPYTIPISPPGYL